LAEATLTSINKFLFKKIQIYSSSFFTPF